MRLDFYLVENGFIKSRERAKEHIKKGDVLVDGKAVNKPAYDISGSEKIEFIGEKLKYVGRGGLKLEKAIIYFNIDLNEKVCMDIGASTGGFTDCMLQNGARLVYAVDVGHDQLDETLIADERVINMERTNINDVEKKMLIPAPRFISVDVSFVSLKNVLPKISEFITDKTEAVVLIKPQFEAGRANIGKNGVVKDKKVHINILNELIAFSDSLGLKAAGLTYSPVSGGDGNIEYLVYIKRKNGEGICSAAKEVVDKAFAALK